MKTKWYYNARDGYIGSYHEYNDGDTDFPKGTFIVDRDYLVTGLDSRADAEKWKVEWHACPKCKSVRKGAVGDTCLFCGSELAGHK